MEAKYLCLILLCVDYANCDNTTISTKDISSSKEREMGKRVLGIFTVIRFPNDVCAGSTSFNGTCYTSDECAAKSGTSSGSCASGFGVCCVFSLECGSTTAQNLTYHTVTSYSATTNGASPCTYTICPCSDDICKLRLDFSAFSIYTPWTSLVVAAGTTGYVPQGIVVNVLDGIILGDCLVDQMTITTPGSQAPPAMCGIGPGQHMYIDASTLCNKVNFNIDTTVTYTRSWSFTVKQIECGQEDANHECLQYSTGTSGTFQSWNFDKTATAVVPAANLHHLNNQVYDICFRQERGYCQICFAPVITTALATSFGVSAAGAAITLNAAAGATLCTGLTTYADYIEINNANNHPVTSSLTNTGVGKLCGASFNADAAIAQAAATTVCSFSVPFRWGVNFNDQEVIIKDCTAAKANTCENSDAGGGGIGFSMHWWQVPC